MAKKWLGQITNAKTRTLMVLGGILVLFFIILFLLVVRKTSPLQTQESRISQIPNITAIPGGVTSEKYQELQEEDNRRRALSAQKTGTSAIATIVGSRDALAQKETFGIEGRFKGDCQCPPQTGTEIIPDLDPLLAAKLINQIEQNPTDALRLMQQNPGLAKALCQQKPTLALKVIENNPEAAKIMLTECPIMAKALAEKNPALFKKLMLDNPELAKKLAENNPELFKKLMNDDPEFAKKMFQTNPDLVKTLMKNDADFAQKMAKQYPELVKQLMQADPEFASILARNNPGIENMLGMGGFGSDKQRLLAMEEERRKQRETQVNAARQLQLSEQQLKQVTALAANMEGQTKAIFQAWNDISLQQFTQGEWKNKKDDKGNTEGSGEAGGTPNASSKTTNTPQNVLVKAGTILFAALDTAINTDEPGPIMATVVAGPYKGSKLIGNITFNASPGGVTKPQKVVLQFTTFSPPNTPASLSVTAVAIDPDTARTALASSVDNHYLLRYGTMFASAFMTGYSKVITSAGTTQVTAANGGSTTTTTPTLSPRQQIFAALGEVGKKWGDAVNNYVNMPPTITVDAGTGIGLLFLADVTGS